MLREMHAPWLVRTGSLYFHKACALHHTSALLRYSAAYIISMNTHNTFYKRNKKSSSLSIDEL